MSENNQNKKVLEGLQDKYDLMWDIFFHGDSKSGTKPGNIYVYEKIAGIREVAKERMRASEKAADGLEK